MIILIQFNGIFELLGKCKKKNKINEKKPVKIFKKKQLKKNLKKSNIIDGLF